MQPIVIYRFIGDWKNNHKSLYNTAKLIYSVSVGRRSTTPTLAGSAGDREVKTMTTITRTSYGELKYTAATAESIAAAQALITAARGKLPHAFDDMAWGKKGRDRGHRIGDARHHEIYDVSQNGHRALICVREVEGTRYGVRTTSKDYYVVARHGRGVRVIMANKAVAAKAAKSAGALGEAIDVALGRAKLTVPAAKISTGYKLLVRTDTAGVYQSAWDGSAWVLGRPRIERATDDHTGGYYYYASLDEALAAAATNDTFGPFRDHDRLAVVEVEASGRHYEHAGTAGIKLCATKLRPVREIASTLANAQQVAA